MKDYPYRISTGKERSPSEEQPERPPVQPERVPLPLSYKHRGREFPDVRPHPVPSPPPNFSTRRSRVTGLRARRMRHSASRQKPSGSLQGVPGTTSFRGALLWLFPPHGQWARSAACHLLTLTGTTEVLVLGKKTAKLASVACRSTRPVRGRKPSQLLPRRF
jgi:hypothetical protein